MWLCLFCCSEANSTCQYLHILITPIAMSHWWFSKIIITEISNKWIPQEGWIHVKGDVHPYTPPLSGFWQDFSRTFPHLSFMERFGNVITLYQRCDFPRFKCDKMQHRISVTWICNPHRSWKMRDFREIQYKRLQFSYSFVGKKKKTFHTRVLVRSLDIIGKWGFEGKKQLIF